MSDNLARRVHGIPDPVYFGNNINESNRRYLYQIPRRHYEHYVLKNFRPLENHIVADIGAGDGWLALQLSLMHNISCVDAVEINEKALEQLRTLEQHTPSINAMSTREFLELPNEPRYGGVVMWRTASRIVPEEDGPTLPEKDLDNILEQISNTMHEKAPFIISVRSQIDRFYQRGRKWGQSENIWVTNSIDDYAGLRVLNQKDLEEEKYHIPRRYYSAESGFEMLERRGFAVIKINPQIEPSGNGKWMNNYIVYETIRDRREDGLAFSGYERRKHLDEAAKAELFEDFRRREKDKNLLKEILEKQM